MTTAWLNSALNIDFKPCLELLHRPDQPIQSECRPDSSGATCLTGIETGLCILSQVPARDYVI